MSRCSTDSTPAGICHRTDMYTTCLSASQGGFVPLLLTMQAQRFGLLTYSSSCMATLLTAAVLCSNGLQTSRACKLLQLCCGGLQSHMSHQWG